jgi:hypothetical protein
VKQLLTDAFGTPTEEWGSLREPACLWQLGAVSVDMYYFQCDPSGTMVGTSHTARSAAYDAAASAHHPEPSRRPITVSGVPADRPAYECVDLRRGWSD